MADFGLSRRLDGNQTTLYTDRAGTKCWEATEILNCENTDENGKAKYKKSTDIQVRFQYLCYHLPKIGEANFFNIDVQNYILYKLDQLYII